MYISKKHLLTFLLILLIYSAYFIIHGFTPQNHVQILGTTNNLLLFKEPQSGHTPLLTALQNASQEIDIEMYLLSDKEIVSSLILEKQKGLLVKVILESHPVGGGLGNKKVYQTLQNAGIKTEWSNPTFSLTHEKAIIIDNKIVFILNQNLTASAFTKNREFDIEDTNSQDVQEVENIFNADWDRKSVVLTDGHLVVSPDTSRPGITTLIQNSKSEIDIEDEVIDDPKIIDLLSQKVKTEKIKIIIPTLSQMSSNSDAVDKLKAAGVQIKTISSPYIHAKLILADSSISYIGSVNLTTESMDQNRELGIIITQSGIIKSLVSDFSSDWQTGQSIN